MKPNSIRESRSSLPRLGRRSRRRRRRRLLSGGDGSGTGLDHSLLQSTTARAPLLVTRVAALVVSPDTHINRLRAHAHQAKPSAVPLLLPLSPARLCKSAEAHASRANQGAAMYGGAAPAVSARDRTSEFSALVERLQVRRSRRAQCARSARHRSLTTDDAPPHLPLHHRPLQEHRRRARTVR